MIFLFLRSSTRGLRLVFSNNQLTMQLNEQDVSTLVATQRDVVHPTKVTDFDWHLVVAQANCPNGGSTNGGARLWLDG